MCLWIFWTWKPQCKANAHPSNLECYTSENSMEFVSYWWVLLEDTERLALDQHLICQRNTRLLGFSSVWFCYWSLLLFQCHTLRTEIPQIMTFLLRGCTDNSYILADNLEGKLDGSHLRIRTGELGTGGSTLFRSHWALRKASFLGLFPLFLLPKNDLLQTVRGMGAVESCGRRRGRSTSVRTLHSRPAGFKHTFADILLC